MASGGTVEDSLGSTCQSASTTSIQGEKVAGLHPTMKQKGGWVLDKVGEVNAKGGFNWPSTSLTLGSLLQPRSRG